MNSLAVAVATAAITVTAPQPTGALLSLAAPGLGQAYAGNPIAGAAWLGLGGVAGIGVFQLVWAGHVPGDSPFSSAQGLFAIALGTGAWLGVGIASTLAAAAEISGKYLAAESALAPPGDRPAVAPAPALTPRPAGRRRRDE
ncbi:MAG: hypothetical protein FJZ01_05525 [Candidatus Sericytochromatia bacterium]|nr:hypothetical protein [Candidatus Tanganyikabacteria bacterium]